MAFAKRVRSFLALMTALACLCLAGCGGQAQPTDPTQTPRELSDISGFRLSDDGSCHYGEVKIRSGDITYYGVMYLPSKAEGKLTTVIMCHGLNADCGGMGIMAKELVKYGYACYCPDFYGGSNRTKSGGKMKEMSILTERRDLMSILDAIRKIEYVDTDNIFLYGESLGGAVITAAAPQIQDQIRGVILSYPALHVPDIMRESYPERNNIPDAVVIHGTTLGKPFAEDVYDLDLYAEAARYSGPVLIQHGTQDTSVDLSVSQKAAACFPNARLIVYEGAGHGFGSAEFRIPAMKALSDFIQANQTAP